MEKKDRDQSVPHEMDNNEQVWGSQIDYREYTFCGPLGLIKIKITFQNGEAIFVEIVK